MIWVICIIIFVVFAASVEMYADSRGKAMEAKLAEWGTEISERKRQEETEQEKKKKEKELRIKQEAEEDAADLVAIGELTELREWDDAYSRILWQEYKYAGVNDPCVILGTAANWQHLRPHKRLQVIKKEEVKIKEWIAADQKWREERKQELERLREWEDAFIQMKGLGVAWFALPVETRIYRITCELEDVKAWKARKLEKEYQESFGMV